MKNGNQISDTKKYLDSDQSSIKTFGVQLASLRQQLCYGEDTLPRIKREVIYLEKNLPLWRDRVRVLELSLKTHRKDMSRHTRLLQLLLDKEKVLAKIFKLEQKKNVPSNSLV